MRRICASRIYWGLCCFAVKARAGILNREMNLIRRSPQAHVSRGLGLISMEARLKLVKGTLSIRSQPKGGTTIDARVPISIRERSAEVEDRAIPGHWEGDLLRGSGNNHIATLVERHSRFVMLIKIPSRDTAEVVGALSKHVRKLPATLRRSLTWDRGLEMAKHKDFTVATDVKVYFCDPQSPWQRGSNENTNGLFRILPEEQR